MRRVTKRICAAVAVLLVAAIVFTTIHFNRITAEADGYVTLPGIETIVLNNTSGNPFIIIEVVADKEDSSLGYLVKGEEPLKEGKALQDMPSADERALAIKNFVDNASSNSKVTSLVSAGALSLPTGTYAEYDVNEPDTDYGIASGYYVQDSAEGQYMLRTPKNAYRLYVPGVDDGENRYTRYLDVDFTGSRDVTLSFKYINSALDKRITYHGENYNMYYVYNVISDSIKSLDTEGLDFSVYTNEPVYYITTDASGAYVYNYYGLMESDGTIKLTTGESRTLEEIGAKDRYAFVSFERTYLGGAYVYADVVDVSDNNGGFGLYSHYEVNNSSGDYVRDKDLKDVYEYMPAYSPYVMDEENFEYAGPYSYVSTDYYEYGGEPFFYKNGITNADWFRNFVMDIPVDQLDSFSIDVKTMTMEEFNAYDVTRANMIYFAGGSYTTDINATQAQNVVSEVVNNKLPVVMDRSFGSGLTNNAKLSTLLRQKDMSIGAVTSVITGQWDNTSQWNNLKNSVNTTSSFVNRSVYINDDSVVPFVYGDFISAISDITGFTAVKSEVDTENEYRKVKLGNSTTLVRDTISKATALRYIINYSNQRITTKTSVKVLEIEPCYSFAPYYSVGNGNENDLKKVLVHSYKDTRGTVHTVTSGNKTTTLEVANLTQETLTEDKVKSWINQDNVNSGTSVDLVQTYTKEFIGKVEDLNENYDLIYIGLDTTTMNTEVEGVNYGYNSPSNKTGTKTNKTIYNDSSMNGLIYSHKGDLVNPGSDKMLWWENGFSSSVSASYRMSGNDITLEKYNDLVEYIHTGYAVVFADKFFEISNNPDGTRTATVNTKVVAKDTYMYKLGVEAAKFININVFLQSDLEKTKNASVLERFKTWLNISKLHVTAKAVPVEYSNTNGNNPVYLNKDTLSYAVELKNDAAIGVTTTTYDVHLYIDISVDGRFTKDEEITGLSVYEGAVSEATKIKANNDGTFSLYAGRTYYIERDLPAGYVGMLPWKLVFTQNGNSTVRRALTGYTALPITSSTRETIKVLQITGELNSFNNNLDLTSTDVKNQLNKVQDFDIQVTKITSKNLIDNHASTQQECLNYLNEYDMLILGFGDCFDFSGTKNRTGVTTKNENASKALAQYINSGRSVLFTHDTTSRFNYDYDKSVNKSIYSGQYIWGYYFNKNVRSVVGMDRYNVLGGSSKYDYYEKDGDTATDNARSSRLLQTHGYTDSELMRYYKNTGYYGTSRPAAADDISDGQYNGKQYYVTKVNEGQITEYPFEIPDRLAVKMTHYQYYQLNLDTDSKDDVGNDDIVVWYCLSDVGSQDSSGTAASDDDIYQMNPNDVRNNYYIYNKGNITYSGVGHSSINVNENNGDISELRLFINTMVAAYKAGVHPPKVVYHDGDSNAPINTAYVPYDHVLKKYLDDEVVLYFEITDSSFVQGERQLEHEFKIIRYDYDGSGNLTSTRSDIAAGIYEVKADGTLGSKLEGELDFDTTYALKLKTADLQFSGDDVMPYVSICVRAQTKYKTEGNTVESGWGEYNLEIRRTELFDLK